MSNDNKGVLNTHDSSIFEVAPLDAVYPGYVSLVDS